MELKPQMRIELMTFALQKQRSNQLSYCGKKYNYSNSILGQNWESNPGPLAPKARIIPLDHSGIEGFSSLLHHPGLEPGSLAWKASMLTPIPMMHISTTGLEPVT